MAGLVGVACGGKREQVQQMLAQIAHRGQAKTEIMESPSATVGAGWPRAEAPVARFARDHRAVWDGSYVPPLNPRALAGEHRPFALAAASQSQGLILARDPIGVRPLYYGHAADGTLCFASEVKALLPVASEVHEFPPGSWFDGHRTRPIPRPAQPRAIPAQSSTEMASRLRQLLHNAICERATGRVGSWLSGGLDSSGIVALAKQHVGKLHTFAAGVKGAPDLGFADQVARYLGTVHHEVIISLPEMLAVLPQVIYHLESFDALLVRSTIMNYLVAERAADYVDTVFSGEGGDELFAGYAYLRQVPPGHLGGELTDLIARLHNTALQRVDRSAGAHGLAVRVPFLDQKVIEYALAIPAGLKLRRDGKVIEKWILRQALVNDLPADVLWRKKVKFWEGAGVESQLAEYAEERISSADLVRERRLPNGWILNTKEELLYYRIFREHFGDLADLTWMGRTKGAPVEAE